MKFIYTLLAITTLSSIAHAENFFLLSPVANKVACEKGCSESPKPISKFSYDAAEKAFAKARKPKLEELNGVYKAIGVTSIAMDFAGLTDEVNSSGLKNSDGSEKFLLTFSGSIDFFDSSKIAVTMSGLGARVYSQGPYEVSSGNDAACFASKTYGTATTSYFNWECRVLGKDNVKMLCGLRMELSNNDMPSYPAQVRYNHQIGTYFGYVRK